MILIVVLITLPTGVTSFFFSKKILKKLSHLFGKIDTFDAFVKTKREVVYWYTKLLSRVSSSFASRIRKQKLSSLQQHTTLTDDSIEHMNAAEIHSLDTDDVSLSPDNERLLLVKKRRIIEKIIYEALGFRKDGKLDEYEKKIIEWLAIDGEDKDLNKLLADLYFTMGTYKKALPILKKIVELDPKDHKAIWQIWEIYLTSSDFDVAELLIKKAIAISPTNPKYYISMVELLYNTERKHDAIIEMEKVIKLRPTNSAYILTLADLYREEGDLDSAKKYYFRVLEYEPSNEKAKKQLKELVVE